MQNISPSGAPQRDEKIIQEYHTRRQRQIWVAIILTPVIIFLASARQGVEVSLLGFSSSTLYLISFLLVVGGLLYTFKNWRCPACNGYFRKEWNPAFCSKCGVTLR